MICCSENLTTDLFIDPEGFPTSTHLFNGDMPKADPWNVTLPNPSIHINPKQRHGLPNSPRWSLFSVQQLLVSGEERCRVQGSQERNPTNEGAVPPCERCQTYPVVHLEQPHLRFCSLIQMFTETTEDIPVNTMLDTLTDSHEISIHWQLFVLYSRFASENGRMRLMFSVHLCSCDSTWTISQWPTMPLNAKIILNVASHP